MSQKSKSKSTSKKSYPTEIRKNAVKLATELGYSADEVAEKLGCSRAAVRRWRAADDLGVRKEKEAFSKHWVWSLPGTGEPDAAEIERPTKGFAEFDAFAEEEF